MSYETPGGAAPVEQRCSYGASKLVCRGPRRDLAAPYFAFLGASETFGRFVKRPFPALVERETGQNCVNLGCTNAGLDAFAADADLMRVAAGAERVVIQALGAQNLSNPYYRVHPRRNDRFLEPSAQMLREFPDVDFTQFNFNKHLVRELHRQAPARFAAVAGVLRDNWVARMAELVQLLPRPPVLLWLRYRTDGGPAALAENPMLVDHAMILELRPLLHAVAEIPVEPSGPGGGMAALADGASMQAAAAAQLIGAGAHYTIADALAGVLTDQGENKKPA